MKLSLDSEQKLLQDSVARFVAVHGTVEERRRLRDKGLLIEPDTWRQMAELGWLGLPFIEAHGGYGGSPVDLMVLMQELGRGLVVQPYVSTVLVCGGLLARAPEAEREKYLPAIIAGESQWAFAFAEHSGRYRLDRVETRAEPDGDGVRLSGTKIAVLNGKHAEHLLVTARSAQGGLGLFLVADGDSAVRRPVTLVDGTPGAEIHFDATPATLLQADALATVEEVVDQVIPALGAQALGSMEALLEMTVEYTRTREQFGQPIGKFQVLQHRMADMYLHCQALRSLLYRAVLAHQEQAPDRAACSSALKVKLGESGRFVAQQAVQLHGGIGMSDELAVGHHFKSLLALNILFGDADYHLDRYIALAG